MLPVIILAASLAVELQGGCWTRRPSTQLDRKPNVYILWVSTDNTSSTDWVRAVHKLTSRQRRAIVAATADSCEQANRFARSARLRIPLLAEVKLPELLAHKTPKLLRLSTSTRNGMQLSEAQLPDGWLEEQQAETTAAEADADRLATLSDADDLEQFIESDADEMVRASAVERLWRSRAGAGQEDFLSFCQAALQAEPSPFVAAKIEYFADLARGIDRSAEALTPSAAAYREFQQNRPSNHWNPVVEFQSSIGQMPTVQLRAAYLQNLKSDVPQSLVRRRLIVDELRERSDKDQARAIAMDAVRLDPDAGIRLHATMALGKLCNVGDEAAAQFLENVARNEPNRLRTRPFMEYTAHYLRTGEE